MPTSTHRELSSQRTAYKGAGHVRQHFYVVTRRTTWFHRLVLTCGHHDSYRQIYFFSLRYSANITLLVLTSPSTFYSPHEFLVGENANPGLCSACVLEHVATAYLVRRVRLREVSVAGRSPFFHFPLGGMLVVSGEIHSGARARSLGRREGMGFDKGRRPLAMWKMDTV